MSNVAVQERKSKCYCPFFGPLNMSVLQMLNLESFTEQLTRPHFLPLLHNWNTKLAFANSEIWYNNSSSSDFQTTWFDDIMLIFFCSWWNNESNCAQDICLKYQLKPDMNSGKALFQTLVINSLRTYSRRLQPFWKYVSV